MKRLIAGNANGIKESNLTEKMKEWLRMWDRFLFFKRPLPDKLAADLTDFDPSSVSASVPSISHSLLARRTLQRLLSRFPFATSMAWHSHRDPLPSFQSPE